MSNGTGISFVNNDRENIRLISNIIANNTVIGITWTPTACDQRSSG
jgi:hypothetical protein